MVLVANPGIVTRTCPRGCVRSSSLRVFSTCLRLLTVRSRMSARLGMIWAQASAAGSSMGWDFTASQIRGAALSDRRGGAFVDKVAESEPGPLAATVRWWGIYGERPRFLGWPAGCR